MFSYTVNTALSVFYFIKKRYLKVNIQILIVDTNILSPSEVMKLLFLRSYYENPACIVFIFAS